MLRSMNAHSHTAKLPVHLRFRLRAAGAQACGTRLDQLGPNDPPIVRPALSASDLTVRRRLQLRGQLRAARLAGGYVAQVAERRLRLASEGATGCVVGEVSKVGFDIHARITPLGDISAQAETHPLVDRAAYNVSMNSSKTSSTGTQPPQRRQPNDMKKVRLLNLLQFAGGGEHGNARALADAVNGMVIRGKKMPGYRYWAAVLRGAKQVSQEPNAPAVLQDAKSFGEYNARRLEDAIEGLWTGYFDATDDDRPLSPQAKLLAEEFDTLPAKTPEHRAAKQLLYVTIKRLLETQRNPPPDDGHALLQDRMAPPQLRDVSNRRRATDK